MLCSLFMVIDYCGSFYGKSSYTCYPLSSKWCKNASWIAFQKQEPDYDYPHEVLYQYCQIVFVPWQKAFSRISSAVRDKRGIWNHISFMLFIVWQYLPAVWASGQSWRSDFSQQMNGWCSEHYGKFIPYPIILFKNNQRSSRCSSRVERDDFFWTIFTPKALQNFIFTLKLLK